MNLEIDCGPVLLEGQEFDLGTGNAEIEDFGNAYFVNEDVSASPRTRVIAFIEEETPGIYSPGLALKSIFITACKFQSAPCRDLAAIFLDKAKKVEGRYLNLVSLLDNMSSSDLSSVGNSLKPSSRAIEFAKSLLSSLVRANFLPDQIAPSSEGGVYFTFFPSEVEGFAAIEVHNEDEECDEIETVCMIVPKSKDAKAQYWLLDASADAIPTFVSRGRSFLGHTWRNL